MAELATILNKQIVLLLQTKSNHYILEEKDFIKD